MPDVVGMDLQLAQDTIQEAGPFYSRSEDATGHRICTQISDLDVLTAAVDELRTIRTTV